MKILLAAALIIGQPQVTDGDTLRFSDQRVRIWGIDAPETNTRAGKAARGALIEIIDNRSVRCEDTGQRSESRNVERIVARCYIGSMDIACELVRLGHAKDWPKYSGGAYRECGR